MAQIKKKLTPSAALEVATSAKPTQAPKSSPTPSSSSDVVDFMYDLFKGINKETGEQALINLKEDDSYISVKRFLPTGSRQLDVIIRNDKNGGLPEGRIIEIFGPTASGKTTLALLMAANVQKMGGAIIYIDSEQALNIKRAAKLGVDITKNFGYSPTTITEKVFDLIEKAVTRIKAAGKDIPVLVIWDSVAAALPKAEAEGTHEQQTIGLQARALRKGLRKTNELLAGQKVTFVILNHVTQKIGVLYGSPDTTTGGTAIPFWSSLRLKIGSPSPIKDGDEITGVTANVKVVKNKIERAFREVTLDIKFDEGVQEAPYIFDTVRAFSDKANGTVYNDKRITMTGSGGWKEFAVTDISTGEILIEKKFHKGDFKKEIMDNPETKEYFDILFNAAYIMNPDDKEHETFKGPEEEDSLAEVPPMD
jgi:recombination protein RecA